MADANEKPKVKCSECGYLAVKKQGAIELPMSADASVRREASHIHSPLVVFDPQPYCFISAQRIDEEYRRLAPEEGYSRGDAPLFLLIIRDERKCDGFCRWDGIKSPQEYVAMQERIEMAKIADASKAREDRNRRVDFWQKLAIAAFAAIASGIIGYVFGNSKTGTFPTSITLTPATPPK